VGYLLSEKESQMKRILVLIVTSLLIGLLILPARTAFADRAFHNVRAPFHSEGPSIYRLKDGFAVATHMNGPVNFEKKEFQLHGAKPNTQFFIYRVFEEDVRLHGTGTVLIPAGTPSYSGFSFWTDEHGNGHVITPLAPTAPSLEAIEGTVSLHITNLLSDGLLSAGGTKAYEAEEYETFFDWKW
jgi:hypothetical protein